MQSAKKPWVKLRARPVVAAAIVAAAGGAVRTARGDVQYWNPASGSTWDVTTANWNPSISGTTDTNTAWNNSNDAIFNVTGSTVTVNGSAGVTASSLTFNAGGYNLTGGTLTLVGAAPTITVATVAPATTTFAGILAGTSGVSYNGSGATGSAISTFNLSGGNTYTGTTVLGKGLYNYSVLANDNVNSAFGSSGNVVLGGVNVGQITLAGSVVAAYTGTGATTNRIWQFEVEPGTSATTISNNGTGPLGFLNTSSAITATQGTRLLILNGTYVGTNTFAEALSDGGGTTTLRVNGSSTWVVSGQNTYTGQTNISAGTLAGVGATAFGATSGIIVAGSAKLSLLGDTDTTFIRAGSSPAVAVPVTTAASGSTINVDQYLGASTARTMTIGALTTLATATTVNFGFTGANNTSLSVGTMTGPTTGTAGTLETVALNNSITAPGQLTLGSYTSSTTAGTDVVAFNGSGNTTITGAIVPSAGVPLSLKVTTINGGTLTLLGSSTFTGGTNLSTGSAVAIAQASSLGVATSPVTFLSSAVASLTATTGMTLANPITLSSGTTAAVLGNSATAGNTFNLSGLISGAGSVRLNTGSTANGMIELSNDSNSFTGQLNVSAGQYAFTSVANSGAGNISSLGAPTAAASIPIVFANGAGALVFQYLGGTSTTTNRAINWTGTTGGVTLDASGVGTVGFNNSNTGLRSGAGAATLTLAGTNTAANTFTQVINDSTAGATSLVKIGGGKWVLTGANTFTGGTNISAGTLVVGTNGTLGTTGSAVLNGGVLAGNGSIGVPVIVNGGNLSGGSGATSADSIGTLTTTAKETWNSSGGYVAKISADATSNDVLYLSGGLTVNATPLSTFNISLASVGSTTLTAAQKVVIAFIPGGAQGSFNVSSLSLAWTNVNGGALTLSDQTGTFNSVSGDELIVSVAAAPEPTSLLLVGLAGMPLVMGRRRARMHD